MNYQQIKGKPSEYRIGINDYNKVWVVSKPNAKLEWESVKGAAMSPKVKGEFNKAPISDFDFYVYHPQKGYIKLDENLNLPGGISVSRTPHIDYLKSLSREEQIKYLTENGLNDQWLWTLENNPDHLESTLSKALIPDKTLHITPENAASITPEQWTAAQDAAIARGDMAEAQRLRDLHFKVNAPNTKVKEAVFNGSLSDKPFYEFNTSFRDAYWGGRDDYTTGAWFGTGDENTMLSFAGDNPNRLRKFYLNFSNPFIKDAGYRRWDKLLPFNMTEEDIAIEAAKLREKGFPEYVIEDWKNGLKTTTDNYALKLENTNYDYDSGIIKNVYENKAHPDSEYGVITDYIASKPNQIKLADAVTYNDKGVRIPLGKRDNFNINDIRYGLLPFISLGTLGTMYGTSKKSKGGKINKLKYLRYG